MEMIGKAGNRPSNVRFVWKRSITCAADIVTDKVHADKSNTSNIAAKKNYRNKQMNMFMGKEIFGKVSNQGI